MQSSISTLAIYLGRWLFIAKKWKVYDEYYIRIWHVCRRVSVGSSNLAGLLYLFSVVPVKELFGSLAELSGDAKVPGEVDSSLSPSGTHYT